MIVLNIVLAFCMGSDLDSILYNEIDQPLAVVLDTPLPFYIELIRRLLDTFQ